MFKVGDKVKVVKIVTSESGWNNSWTGCMGESVNNGKIYTVKRVNDQGVYFYERNMGFPPGSLSHVVEVPELTATPVVDGRSIVLKFEYNGKIYDELEKAKDAAVYDDLKDLLIDVELTSDAILRALIDKQDDLVEILRRDRDV